MLLGRRSASGNRVADRFVLRACGVVLALLAFAGVALAQAAGKVEDSRSDHRNSLAVIIGNAKYEHTTPVPYAHNDARAIQDYLVRRLGFRRENIVLRLDLGRERMETLFGEPDRPDGELMERLLDRRLENRGDVFVFYSGHGVPDPDSIRDDDRRAFLLPVDVRQDRIGAAAYPIERLQKKLDLVRGNLPQGRNVVLMLDACFSGRTPSPKVAEGDVSLFRFSRGSFTARLGQPQAGLVRLVAATGDQVAYWDDKAKLGLFTSLFLKAVGGDADGTAFGNGDRQVDGSELTRYLEERLPAEARLRHQRSQRPTLEALENFRWTMAPAIAPSAPVAVPIAAPAPALPIRPAVAPVATPAPAPPPRPAAAPVVAPAAPVPPRAAAAPSAPVERAAPSARPVDRVRPPKPVRRAVQEDDDDEEEIVRPRRPQPRAVRRAPETPAAPLPQASCRTINGVRFCG